MSNCCFHWLMVLLLRATCMPVTYVPGVVLLTRDTKILLAGWRNMAQNWKKLLVYIKKKRWDDITKIHLYNFDPLKPHFYIVKLGFTGIYIIFLILLKNIDCGYSLELPHHGSSNEYPQSMFLAEWVLLFCGIWSGSTLHRPVCLNTYSSARLKVLITHISSQKNIFIGTHWNYWRKIYVKHSFRRFYLFYLVINT